MRKSICTLSFLLSLLFLLFFPRQIFAGKEFIVSLDSEYRVDKEGKTSVANLVRIRNQFSTVYAKNYEIEINSRELGHISARALDGQEYATEIHQEETKTRVVVVFPDKMIGKDKERSFLITYDAKGISSLSGRILEINVPKLINQVEIDEYKVTLKVPAFFNRPSFSQPQQYEESLQLDDYVYTFGPQAKEGVRLLFGDRQIFRFSLRYHLNNPSISQGIAQVALPPDTAYQKVVYEVIDPPPDNIQTDPDGNWIATFTIAAQKEQEVTVSGYVSIYLQPLVQISSTNVDKQYFSETQYWKAFDSEIQKLAKELKTPRQVYDYIVQNFKYDYARLALGSQVRQGSFAALRNPTGALCQDFTDTFIALSRAAGIPARELNGYAHTDDSVLRPLSLIADVLHAWPEYYDEKLNQWIPVDPTWGNTTNHIDFFSTLDFNHFVFVIHGLSDELPYPAGMYKISGKEEKDVQISVETTDLPSTPPIEVELLPPSFSNPSTITVKNLTGTAWYNIPVSVGRSSANTTQPQLSNIAQLLPYQQTTVEIPAQRSLFSLKKHGTISVTIGGKTITYEQTQGTTYPILLVGIALAGSAAVAGSLLVFRKRR